MRKMPIGAEIIKEGVHFRVWAPKCKKVEVVLENGKMYPLKPEKNGYFSAFVENVASNTLYQFILDEKKPLPDPASRFQPLGPDGPSQVIDFNKFKWTDSSWKGITEKQKVILYELHIGTFTEEGTWVSAKEKLRFLKEMGINVIEMMPICEWPGRFNWGYDGVDLFAPTRNYGRPDDLKSFINEAHQLGIGVILDVVYNHFGPEGSYLNEFSDYYMNQEANEWGGAPNFDGENCEPVREFFIENAGYWIEEFHFDGLRIDACQNILDSSTPHILLDITQQVREKAGKRKTYVTAENERQQAHYVFSEKKGGFALDAIWNEDFHHTSFVRLTGRNEAYLNDFSGKAQEFISCVKYGFLYQGQWYAWQKQGRGSPALDLPAHHFIHFLENHDQVANTGIALRLPALSHMRVYRAMTALFLLSPQIPLLFQGQEFGSTSPFYYFCDHNSDLAEKVIEGRLNFMSQFKSLDNIDVQTKIPAPHEFSTFQNSKLNWKEKESKPQIAELYKDLLAIRKNDPVFGNMADVKIDGAVLNENAFILRYFSKHGERLLLINFGIDLHLFPAPEPLLSPPLYHEWSFQWSSEMTKYGGFGYLEIPKTGNWILSGYSALLLYAEETKTLKK